MDFHRYVREHLPPLTISREPEIVDELALHLADLYQEGLGAGLEHDAALARAVAAIPRQEALLAREIESASRALPALIADRWRASHDVGAFPPSTSGSWPRFGDFRRDLRYAVRMLARTPAFTFVIALTLALGIGANAVIFSAVDAVLLQRAPVADPSSVVSIYTTGSDGRDRFSTTSYPDYVDLRDAGLFQSVAVFAGVPFVLQGANGAESVTGELVSGNYFDVLGVTIPLGRAFSPEEDRSGAPLRVVIISHGAWTNRFGADSAIVGRLITLNGNSYTVVGVAPKTFTGPILGRAPEIWAPAALQPELRPPSAGLRRSLGGSNMLAARGPRWLNMVARLSPGGTLASTAAAADVLSARLETAYPASNRGRRFTVVPLGDGPGVRSSAAPMLRLLSGAVVLVLLIACANVASLLLARAVARRREIAVRMAVGAGRGRLVRQWLTESVLLAIIGSLGGLLIAWWGAPVLYQFGIPESVPLGVTNRVFIFTLTVAVASGLLFGLAPVIQTLRRNTVEALRDEGGAVASGAGAMRMRSTFVVAQVALSLMLLVGAGLFLRTLRNATAVDLGYDVDQMMLADINMDVRGYSQDAGQAAYTQLLERLNALPGVEAAGAARVTVLSGSARTVGVSSDGRPVADDNSNAIDVRANVISDRYLEAMGIRVRSGRGFTPGDAVGGPRVVIISQSLATRLFPGIDPNGRTVMMGRDPLQVVGVVPDTIYRSTIEQNPPPFLYVPLLQNYEAGITLHLRVAGDPRAMIAPARRVLSEVDPQLVLGRPRVLRDEFTRSMGDQRMMATMVGLFGVVALVLAAIGLSGVMAHLAGQRTTEIGIRLALGARPSSIFGLMLKDGLKLVAIGSVIGLAGAFAGARFLENQLFGVTPADPLTFAGVSLTLIVVAVAACLIPARRAMRVDPMRALRSA
ncbi:MAG: ABC transporter permease [Vicinamibacterales bacterium]